jgi:hypothetical protein
MRSSSLNLLFVLFSLVHLEVMIVPHDSPIPPFDSKASLKALVISMGGTRQESTISVLSSIGFHIRILRPPPVDGHSIQTGVCSNNYIQLRAIEFIGTQKLDNPLDWRDWIWVFEDDIAIHPNVNERIVRDSILEFMRSTIATNYSLAYLGGCTVMHLTEIEVLHTGVDVSKGCFLCNHAYGLRPTLASSYPALLKEREPNLVAFCLPVPEGSGHHRLALDVAFHSYCRHFNSDKDTRGDIILGARYRSPIPKFSDSQMGLLYQDRLTFHSTV